MATSAPYYQVRTNQDYQDVNSSSGVSQIGVPHDANCNMTTVASTKQPAANQHLLSYPENAARQPGTDGQHSEIEHNHTLVGLLEAATTAADQATSDIASGETPSRAPDSQTRGKRSVSLRDGGVLHTHEDLIAKRRRIDVSPTDPNLEANDDDDTLRSQNSKDFPYSLRVDARAAGVHSAVALFRPSNSSATRKHTRPPMSKLFMSLNITPENFIALQALAKTYMLSPDHPERQACVGNRGKGDTDAVKLRLFNCVRDFLANDEIGERFFGEHAEKPDERESSEAAVALGEKEPRRENLLWPRDGNKVISLVTPLMRRMVTNERQRLYAIDSRKGGKRVEKEGSVEGSIHHSASSTPAPKTEQQLQAALDPTLQRSLASESSLPSTPVMKTNTSTRCSDAIPLTIPVDTSPSTTPFVPLLANSADPHLTNINIFLTTPSSASKVIKLDEKRISTTRPAHLTFYNYTAFLEQVTSMVRRAELLRTSISPPQDNTNPTGDSENLRGLAAAANALQPDKDDQQLPSAVSPSRTDPTYIVKTVGPTGWKVIDSAEDWYHVLTERAFATWADGVCNILVEVGAAQGQGTGRRMGGAVVEEASADVQMGDV